MRRGAYADEESMLSTAVTDLVGAVCNAKGRGLTCRTI